jgi:hypothetical protein
MKQGKLVALIGEKACTAVMGLVLIALPTPRVNAQQPPGERCRPASKIEYNAAKKQFLLTNRFGGMYLRTGRIWRRYYWYCQ